MRNEGTFTRYNRKVSPPPYAMQRSEQWHARAFGRAWAIIAWPAFQEWGWELYQVKCNCPCIWASIHQVEGPCWRRMGTSCTLCPSFPCARNWWLLHTWTWLLCFATRTKPSRRWNIVHIEPQPCSRTAEIGEWEWKRVRILPWWCCAGELGEPTSVCQLRSFPICILKSWLSSQFTHRFLTALLRELNLYNSTKWGSKVDTRGPETRRFIIFFFIFWNEHTTGVSALHDVLTILYSSPCMPASSLSSFNLLIFSSCEKYMIFAVSFSSLAFLSYQRLCTIMITSPFRDYHRSKRIKQRNSLFCATRFSVSLASSHRWTSQHFPVFNMPAQGTFNFDRTAAVLWCAAVALFRKTGINQYLGYGQRVCGWKCGCPRLLTHDGRNETASNAQSVVRVRIVAILSTNLLSLWSANWTTRTTCDFIAFLPQLMVSYTSLLSAGGAEAPG